MFTAAGESVSLSCSSTSSLGVGGSVAWAVGERLLTDDNSPCKGRCHVNTDSSLVISKVSALHAGEYRCSESADRHKVLNKIWLYTLDGECERVCQRQAIKPALITAPLQVRTSPLMFVPAVTSERGPGGDNLTLTCVLTCSKECKNDFNLTWSEAGQASWQSGLLHENNTLIKRIFVPVLSTASGELTCTVRREGAVVASKKWHTVNRKYASCYWCLSPWIKPEHEHTCLWFRMTVVLMSTALQTPAWFALPLGLLICITAGGLWVYMKRKHNKDAGKESGLNVGNVHFCKPRIWRHFTF